MMLSPSATNLPWWHRPSKMFWGILGLFGCLALAYNAIFPPFEPTDEWAHFRYVRFLVEERALPTAQPNDPSEYHQPPLYYALAAALSWPFAAEGWDEYQARVNPYRAFRYWEVGLDNKNLFVHGPWDAWPFRGVARSVHVARLASLLCGLVTVLATYQLARARLAEALALAVTGLVAFLPMFVAVSGSLQNDAGAAACGAVFLWLGAYYERAGLTVRRASALGLVIGVGVLMKITALFLLAPALWLLALWGWRTRRWRTMVGHAVALGLSLLVSGGGWYLRNQLLYGEPTAINVNLQAYGGRTLMQGVAVWGQALPYAWTTFWGRFGHGDVTLPEAVYSALAILTLLALPGLAGWFIREKSQRAWLLFLGIAGIAEFIGLMGYLTLSPSGYMGRYTFPALAAYMTLLLIGWLAFVPLKLQRWMAAAWGWAMLGFAALVFGGYLWPVYTAPPALSALPSTAQPLEATLGEVARVRGYEVSATHAQPGDLIYVTVYWEPLGPTPLPYSVYLHLFDSDETLVAQRDTYPGLGRYATTAWEAHHLFADRYVVALPETTYAPTTATWRVGLWQAETGEHVFVVDDTGQPIAADVAFGPLTLTPHPGATPNPIHINFGNVRKLLSYQVSARALLSGQGMELTLYWQEAPTPPEPLEVFIHVTDVGGNQWVNQVFTLESESQVLKFALADDTPLGLYNLEMGVLDAAGQRLKIMAEDGHEVADHLRLTGLRVQAP